MKIYIIKVSAESPFKDYKKLMGGPSQNIFSAAAASPSNVELEMCDELIDMKINYKTKADLVAIFMATPDAIKAYQVASKFRKNGKTVVLGGLHTSFMPEEALNNADAIIIGELEGIWEELIHDFQNGKLKKQYQRTECFDLKNLNPYPTNIIPPWKYNNDWSILVSRGCSNACSYCTVQPFFKSMRYRPIENIVEEIKNCGTSWIELHSDNLTHDRDYAIELFKAIKPLNVKWGGETTINLAKDEELLKLGVESGMKFMLLGLETPSRKALDKAGKGFIDINEVKRHIQLFHDYNIMIDSAFLFGFDEHDKNIFEETYEFAKEINIDSIHTTLLIPFPGTPLFRKLKSEGRILTEDWSKYDGNQVVFEPKNMSVEELENGAYWFYLKTKDLHKKKSSKFFGLFNL
jgi:radical SAM superfamily enzyme YgiQ (UPF0313 family)